MMKMNQALGVNTVRHHSQLCQSYPEVKTSKTPHQGAVGKGTTQLFASVCNACSCSKATEWPPRWPRPHAQSLSIGYVTQHRDSADVIKDPKMGR